MWPTVVWERPKGIQPTFPLYKQCICDRLYCQLHILAHQHTYIEQWNTLRYTKCRRMANYRRKPADNSPSGYTYLSTLYIYKILVPASLTKSTWWAATTPQHCHWHLICSIRYACMDAHWYVQTSVLSRLFLKGTEAFLLPKEASLRL